MNRYYLLSKAFIRDRSRNDFAYIGNFWAELLSTFFYVVTFILFTQLLFTRINTFGSFTKDDFLFMTLVGQFTFYVWAQVIGMATARLVENVRSGAFDFILLRPISAKFYTYISALRPVFGIFVSLPNIILLCIVIDWSSINVTTNSFISGVIVWLCAMLVLNTVVFIFAMPVFTQGDATDMISVSYALFSITEVPYNLLPGALKFASFTILPTLLATAGTAFVMLQKGPAGLILFGSICAAIIAVVCFNVLWNKALNSYSSASS